MVADTGTLDKIHSSETISVIFAQTVQLKKKNPSKIENVL